VKFLNTLILVILISGCMSSETQQQITTTTAITEQGNGCKSLATEKERDDCYLAKAKDAKSISICAEITDQNLRSNCVSAITSDIAQQRTTTTARKVVETTTTSEMETTTSVTETTVYETTSTTEEEPMTGEVVPSSTTMAAVTSTTMPSDSVKVYFLDVGYGDSTLVMTSKSTVLTNCGRSPTALKSILDGLGIKKVDYLIMTQPTEEDYSGCADIMEWMNVDHVLETGQQPYNFKSLYTKFEGLALQRDNKHVGKGFNITVDGVRIQVLNPPEKNPTAGDLKTNSLVYRLAYGKNSILLTGDCDSTCDGNLISGLSADILRVPNNGPESGLSADFISQVKPKAAIVARGPKAGSNPSMDTMGKLRRDNIPQYFIGTNGTIKVEMTSSAYEMSAIGD
jgi:competence protein ComEC